MNPLPAVIDPLASAERWRKVGSSTYRKFGFKVYDVALWAPYGAYDGEKSFALQLRYARAISQKTLIDAIMEDFARLRHIDGATLRAWRERLAATLPDVVENQELIGVSQPGKEAFLVSDGRVIGTMPDQVMSRAFFDIWLGEHADLQMRRRLLGQSVH